ncbi:MAG TPA: OmpA family protein, partial [Candidatus Kapabacteria bacterium]|nr:OmpA family protein [Candidatus Kapabacteria bacterium]
IALPLGKIYGFFAEKEGYYPQAKNIDTRSMQTASDTTFTFTLLSLESIKRGAKSVIIENIFFDFDSYTIQPTSFPELQRLIQLLQKEKELAIEIGGHTDEQGSNSYNLQLSKQRAMAVKEYLIAQGIEKERLTIRGYGKQKPLSTAKNQEKQSINRRVEFTVLKKKGKNR